MPPGLSIDSSTGVISGTIEDGDSLDSPYTVVVAAIDSVNNTVGASETFQWNVAPIVDLDAPASLTVVEGNSVNLALQNVDSAGNPLVFTASGLPPGLFINASTGVISGTVGTAGTYSATVTGTNPAGISGSETISWTVESSGTITMTLSSISNRSNVTGDSVSFSVSRDRFGQQSDHLQRHRLAAGVDHQPQHRRHLGRHPHRRRPWQPL